MPIPSQEPSARQQELLSAYADAIRASPHNLLSRRALNELEGRHIAECVAFARGLGTGSSTLLDLGTGGGLPGLVVAIMRPDLTVTLLDATAKKVAFVAETAAELGVNVATLHGRAEDLAVEHAGRFDLVCARAVAPLVQLVRWSLPFLRPGGVLHAIKGERWADELTAALPTLRAVGARVIGTPPSGDVPPSPDAHPRVVSIAAAS